MPPNTPWLIFHFYWEILVPPKLKETNISKDIVSSKYICFLNLKSVTRGWNSDYMSASSDVTYSFYMMSPVRLPNRICLFPYCYLSVPLMFLSILPNVISTFPLCQIPIPLMSPVRPLYVTCQNCYLFIPPIVTCQSPLISSVHSPNVTCLFP